jgi:hypothetical protein
MPGIFQKRGPRRQQRRAWGMEKEAGREVGRDGRDGKKARTGAKGALRQAQDKRDEKKGLDVGSRRSEIRGQLTTYNL